MTEDENKTKAQLIDEIVELRSQNAAREGAEEALRESERRLHEAQQIAGMGFLDWNLETDAIELSNDVAKMIGLDPDVKWVTPQLVEQICHPDDKDLLREGLTEAIDGDKKFNIDLRIVLSDGGAVRWFHAQADLIRDKEGKPVRLLGTVVDITDCKQTAQEQLDLQLRVQQAQKLESLGTLAGGIAHDFNNLLMGVLGNAELALTTLPPEAPARGDIESVRQAATRAAELANQMLAYSGKGHFVTKTVSLSEAVQNMAHLLEASLPKTTILDYQLDEKVPPIEADESQIRQVIMNFVTNASEALEGQSGVVRIITGTMECDRASLVEVDWAHDCSEGTYGYLEVTDTGVGMDAKTASSVFDPFFTTKFTGRGLGLAAVFGIVRGHRGAIKVDSEPGNGTTIRALFPVAKEPVRAPQYSPTTEAGPAPGNTILLVDDEPSVLDVTTRMLAMSGYQVRTARDGYEAVEVFKKHSQDIACVILDWMMPKMGGERTLAELQKIKDDVPVLLSSGYTVEEVEARVCLSDFAGFIKKPYRMNELLRYLRKVVETE